ncbi:branched-chain amino acid ABC transporter permease [Carboxydochorda subterranea]|uniref:Branched-chain amino acid ABC transporter permease n=1 Tax=Carboxydichorda subterranea TaxID=3109565 RepID=A0ABZ1C0I9_9FIRM|nr:branched-chain amino acid ABC transporter permease [Limnochorda sp. L945t]WRP17842.1 branched-chain amino acid ABC transporter permease [Limnochorda sp. L945t]
MRLTTPRPLIHRLRGARAAALLVLLAVAAFPLVVQSPYWIDVANFYGIYALLALSLNLVVGEAGLFDLGHAAFYAVGAYVTAILNTLLHWPTLWLFPVSFVAAAAAGVILTRPILHLRGDYLAMVTIGFGEIVRIALTNNLFGLTGGPNGIFGIARPALGPWAIRQPAHYFYYIWSFVAAAACITVRLQQSRIGRAWNYIREDEVAAQAMGIDVVRMKLLAFALGAGLAGVAGNLYAARMTVIAPERFNFWESVVIFSMVVLGGPGSVPGVLLGAFALWVLPELFREFAQARMLVFGAAMVAMMVFRPEGLWPGTVWLRATRSHQGEGGAGSAPEAGATGIPGSGAELAASPAARGGRR